MKCIRRVGLRSIHIHTRRLLCAAMGNLLWLQSRRLALIRRAHNFAAHLLNMGVYIGGV